MFQTMNSGKSVENQTFTQSECLDIGLKIFEFVVKTQFLYKTFIKTLFFNLNPSSF